MTEPFDPTPAPRDPLTTSSGTPTTAGPAPITEGRPAGGGVGEGGGGDTTGAAELPPRTPLDAYALILALAIGTLVVPTLSATVWVPKAAVLLTAAAVGLPLLAVGIRDRRRPAMAAGAFVAVTALSTALSRQPDLSLVGQYGVGTGWLYVASLVGIWAVGTCLTDRGRHDLRRALVAVVVANLAVAALAQFVDLSFARLPQPGIRPAGLVGNPIHLAALGAGAIGLAAAAVRNGHWVYLALAVAGGFVTQLSGSRSGVVGAIGALVAVAVARRWRAAAGLVAVVVVGALASGFVFGLANENLASRLGRDVDRAITGAAAHPGYGARLDAWASARHSIADRPLLGVGPGLFRDAVSPHRTDREARYGGGDRYYYDAHNIVVEYVTTTGLLGVAALLTFLVLAVRGTAGPLRWFALALLPVYLLQPQSNSTVPLALLALGAARTGPPLPAWRPHVALRAVPVAVATVAGLLLVYGDAKYVVARLDASRSAGRTAAALFPFWAPPATTMAEIYEFRAYGVGLEQFEDEVNLWREEAIRREPYFARMWSNAGHDYFVQPDLDRAGRAFDRALELNPKSVHALIGRGKVAGARRDWPKAIESLERALDIQPGNVIAEQLLRTARARAAGAPSPDRPPEAQPAG